MRINKMYIIGAGGHAKVVLDAVKHCANPVSIAGLIDETYERKGESLYGIRINEISINEIPVNSQFHVAIGNNVDRQRLSELLKSKGLTPLSVFHKMSSVSKYANIAGGVFAAACSTLGPSSKLHEGVIVNHNAIVDHDCHISMYSHVGPGAILGGNVKIGKKVFIGSGASVLPGLTIVDNVVIGSGAVVVRDILEPGTYVGVPAKKVG